MLKILQNFLQRICIAPNTFTSHNFMKLYSSKFVKQHIMQILRVKRNFPAVMFVDGVAALFIFLFVYTAVSKLFDFEKFEAVLSASPLLGSWSVYLAWTIPFAEFIIATLLFFPPLRKKGLIFSFALMILFTIYIAYMILFTPHLPCSCGGVIQQLSWRQHFILNVGLTTAAATALYFDRNKFLLQ